MLFTFTPASERTHAITSPSFKGNADEPHTPKTRSTPQTRRRNDLPDTKTIRVSTMNDNDRLRNKILDADPNRELHYNAPTLKRRILR